jgi:ABC-type transport system substrate-binding protein
LATSASEPDADTWLTLLYGPNTEQNLGRFRLARYDELYEQARVMPDTPERTRLYQEMTKLIVAYAPWRINSNRIRTDMWYSQLVGYRRHPILTFNTWKFVDVDERRK